MVLSGLIVFGLFSSTARVVEHNQSQFEVRVRLERQIPAFRISGRGVTVTPLTSYETQASHYATSKAKNGFQEPLRSGHVKLTANGIFEITWHDKLKEFIKANQVIISGLELKLNDRPAPNLLVVHRTSSRNLDVTAQMELDKYLLGVLPSEMPLTWPLEALKAQVVAARSFALSTAKHRRDLHFDIDSTVIDQVYSFFHESQTVPVWKNKLLRALRETEGQVLVDQRGAVLKAFYSADCGCQTEDPKYVWGTAHPQYISVKDSSCLKRKPRVWTVRYAHDDWKNRLAQALSLGSENEILDVQVLKRTPSKRVRNLLVITNNRDHEQFVVTSQQFRSALGYSQIQSTDFKISKEQNDLVIEGQGMGHGVGLCQTGARVHAKEGMSHEQILKLYYPRAQFLRGTIRFAANL